MVWVSPVVPGGPGQLVVSLGDETDWDQSEVEPEPEPEPDPGSVQSCRLWIRTFLL